MYDDLSAIEATVGRTPVLHLTSPHSNVLIKYEGGNPSGSVKDRAAVALIRAALDSGLLIPESRLVEESSGNLGLALALVTARLRIAFHCVVDVTTPSSVISMMKAAGARVTVVEDAGGDHQAARRRAVRTLAVEWGAIWPHAYMTAGTAAAYGGIVAELLVQAPGIDAIVAPVGTGGLITGIAEALHGHGHTIPIFGVLAAGSVRSETVSPPRVVPGFGAPLGARDLGVCAGIACVTDEIAVRRARQTAVWDGLLVGGSGGAAIAAATDLAATRSPGATVVAIVPDHGARYVDTIFDADWRAAYALDPPPDQHDDRNVLRWDRI